MKIPRENNWSQNNKSDVLGSVWASKNLDFKKLGEVRISPRMFLNTSENDLANLGVPCAFAYFPTNLGTIWAIAGSRVFKTTKHLNTAFVQDDIGGTPTNLNSNTSDIVFFNSALYFSGGTTSLYKLSSGAVWSTLTSRVNNSSGLHMFAFLRKTNRIYFVDDNSNSIGSMDNTDTAATMGDQTTLQNLTTGGGSDAGEQITWIKATDNEIFIGTLNSRSANGIVYIWDGSTANAPNRAIPLHASGSIAATVKDGSVYLVDTNGKLRVFNGSSFVEIAEFPIGNKIFGNILAPATERPIHYNGMSVVNGEVNILVNGAPYDEGFPQSVHLERFPSGIWEYRKDIGLYHKNSLCLSKSGEDVVDFGQSKISLVGALAELNFALNDQVDTPGSQNGSYCAGAKYYTNSSTTKNGIFYEDSKDENYKSGHIITPKIHSAEIEDTFQFFFARFKKFASDDDKIVVKYRTEFQDLTEATITWAGDNLINTSDDVSDYIVGDEVEVLNGQGAGHIATIESILLQDGVYNITLDHGVSDVSGTAVARFQKWENAGIWNGDSNNAKFVLGVKNIFVQLKVIFYVTGDWSLYDLDLSSVKNK